MKKRLTTLLLALALLLGCAPLPAAAAELQASDALVTYLKNGEGFRAEAYASGGSWFIGYGCACDPADYPNGITELQAEVLMREKLARFAEAINAFAAQHSLSLTQGRFDALCALSYSVGTGWLNAGNRLPTYLSADPSQYTEQELATAFAVWCHVGGAVSEPLLGRRITELGMFFDEDTSAAADGWCWLILDPNGGSNAYSDVAVYRAGAAYGTLPQATRAGWFFAGWQTADGTLLRAGDTVTQNLRVTAQWSLTAPAEETPDAPAAEESPETPETRYEMPEDKGFPDVQTADWFYSHVARLVSAGVVHGYDDGRFRPENQVTWGEALKLIVCAAGFAEQTPEEDAHWASAYLSFAEKKNYLAANSVKNLDAPITRNEIADLCAAALELPAPTQSTAFADTDRSSVRALYEAGILEGSFENGQRVYKGADRIKRSEICAVLTRMLDYVAENFVFVSNSRARIDYTLNMCSYDSAAYYTENGRTYYGGAERVRYGIDVSAHQGEIDWKAVAADGIDFAILRCGYRGYSGGTLNEDDYFRQNITGALAAGLDVGVYFFSQATSVAEALEEAEYTLSLIKDYRLSFPVVFDWEQITYLGSRTRTYSGKTVTDCTVAFCDAIAAAGYTPMAYFNKTLAYLKLDMHRIQNYDGWLAHYTQATDYLYDYQMWQYGSSGSVNGISGRVDMNIAFKDFAS